MRAALLLALTLGLSAPGAGFAAGAQEIAAKSAGSTVTTAQGITLPVISGWVMWRVRVAGRTGAGAGDVTVRLNDVAQVTPAEAEAAGRAACKLLGRVFVAAPLEVAPDAWTWRGACL